MSALDLPTDQKHPSPLGYRTTVALIIITAATAQAFGLALRAPAQYGANDISRWCTVWSLLEKGTYAIDDCPWQSKTQDKVFRPAPFLKVEPGQKPVEHYYSSKPPFLPTLIAGLLYPFRTAIGVPLDQVVPQAKIPRYVDKEVDGVTQRVLETPETPVKWSVHVFYFDPIVLLLNILPLTLTLVLFRRFLDRHASNDWAWFLSLAAASWGVLIYPFGQTLNNHSIAAYSAFLALLALSRISDQEDPHPRLFAAAGFFGAFCVCNELPAALFGLLLFAAALLRDSRKTLLYFATAAALPLAFYFITQYMAFGQLRPVYEEFGTRSYKYEGSYWNTPLEMDWFNDHPESHATYFFHMTFGHHGVFSLTPLVLFSLYGAAKLLGRKGPLRPIAFMSLALTLAMLAFYTWNPRARNYGGSTQGLRWLFWLIPFWLLTLPRGVQAGQHIRWVRWCSLAALAISVFSVGYALQAPWSHPWILDLMEHLNMYALQR